MRGYTIRGKGWQGEVRGDHEQPSPASRPASTFRQTRKAEGGDGWDVQRQGQTLGGSEAGPVPQEQQRPQPDLQQDQKRRLAVVTANPQPDSRLDSGGQ